MLQMVLLVLSITPSIGIRLASKHSHINHTPTLDFDYDVMA